MYLEITRRGDFTLSCIHYRDTIKGYSNRALSLPSVHVDQNIALYHKYAKLLVSMEKKIPPNFYLIDQSRNAMKG